MLGEKIKQYRVENNLTQDELASKLFVTRNAVSKWENNNGYPCIDTLKDIAKLLNITVDDLISDNNLDETSRNYSEKTSIIKKYLINVITFLSYCVIGILIPYLIFAADPTGVMAYCLFIGPVTFVILGLVTPLYNKKMLNSLIAAALSITPILIYFEVGTNVIMYQWEIIYFILFIASYCLMLKIMKVNLKDNKNIVMVNSFFSSIPIFLSVK